MDDTWIRGIDISTCPDGSGYLIDWNDTGECHDHTGVHRNSGRIYQISYGKTQEPDLIDLDLLSVEKVERLLRHTNV